jgi:outer membrane protein TolC
MQALNRRHLIGLSLAYCVLTSACGLLPRHAEPTLASLPVIKVPAAWSLPTTSAESNHQPSDLTQWWQHFHDPLLTQLIGQSLQHNTSVNIAQANLQQARALNDVALASLWPQLSASTSAQRNRNNSQASSQGSNKNSSAFRAGFDASWEPDIFGVLGDAVAASKANQAASAISLADIQISIAAEVAINYIQLRGAQLRLLIANENLKSQLETLQITNWRAQAGLLTSLESEQALTAAEQLQAQIPVFDTAVAQLLHGLLVLCGQPPDSQSPLQQQLNQQLDQQPAYIDSQVKNSAAQLVSLVPQTSMALAYDIPAVTLRKRPDIRSAEWQVSAATARVIQAEAARYPNFQLSGSLGLQSLTLGSLTNSASLLASLLASVSAPIIDGGARRAQVRVETALLEQSRNTYRATVLHAIQEVEDDLIILHNDQQRLQHLQLAADAANNAWLLARQRYSSGLIDFQTVLETQRALFNTQDAVASTSTDVSADMVRLYKAFGGGWVGGSADLGGVEATSSADSPIQSH